MTDEESGKLDQLFSGADQADGGPAIDPATTLKGQITALLRERRFEEALELLYAARWHTPDAPEISRGINLLKGRLIRRYAEELGDLDAVPSIAPGVNRATIEIGDEERALLHLIDGISSFTDIAHQSRLGRLETYRALGRVVREGIVEVAPPPGPRPLPAPRHAAVPASAEVRSAPSELEKTPTLMLVSAAGPLSAPPIPAAPRPPRRRGRGLLIGAVSFAVTGTVGFTWWAITESAPSLPPGAAVAGVPVHAGPTSASPLASARSSHSTPPTAPGSRPMAVLEPDVKPAPPEATGLATPGAIRRSSRSAPKSEERSKTRGSSRGAATVELVAAGRPHPANAGASIARASVASSSRSSPASPVDENDAPSLPELPERVATGGGVEAPQGLVKASATSFAPASISVATNDLTVRGPLGRSVVEQGVARAQADFRACYAARAAAVRRNAAGTARISLTIDEGGYATAVSAQGAPLPGLDGCLQDAARRIRTRVHPDVGLATVAFAVVFSIGGPGR